LPGPSLRGFPPSCIDLNKKMLIPTLTTHFR
jgi:hypothetical protein